MTLKRKHDDPNGFARTTFVSMPREIRDEIYHHALVSRTPIIVRKKDHVYHRAEGAVYGEFSWEERKDAPAQSLVGLTPGLFHVSRTVSDEARDVFYARNTFKIDGYYSAKEICDWLEAIGPYKRNLLSKLELDYAHYTVAWQFADGSRIPYSIHDPIHQRNNLLHCQGDKFEEGQVFDIEPEWQGVFRLLGSARARTSIRIFYRCAGYFGSYLDEDNENCANGDYYASLDIPNLFEAWRAKYSSAQHEIEVIWRQQGEYKDDHDILRPQFERNGFVVVSHRIESITPATETSRERCKTEWLLKMKPLIDNDSLIADEPNPWPECPRPDALVEQEERELEDRLAGDRREE